MKLMIMFKKNNDHELRPSPVV